MPGSGCSCIWDRAGSARSCTGRPCCATGETPASTVTRVRDPVRKRTRWISWSRGRTKVRLGRWIRTGWVLYVSTCVKLCVACTVCSVSRMHGAGYGPAEHVCSRGESLGSRGLFFFICASDVMAACTCVRVRHEGVIPCRMVPSMWDEVHGQLHDVTGEVQRARLIAAQVREVRVAVLDAHFKF